MRISTARRRFVVITVVCLTGCRGGSLYNPFARSRAEVAQNDAPAMPSQSATPEVSLPGSGGYADAGGRSSNTGRSILPPGEGYSDASYRDSSAGGYARDWDRQRSPLPPTTGYSPDTQSGYGGMASREPYERSTTPLEGSLYSGIRDPGPSATTGADLYQRAGASSYLGSRAGQDSLGGYGRETGGFGQPYASTGVTPPADSSLGGPVQSNPTIGGSTTADQPLYSGTSRYAGLDRSAPGYSLPPSVASSSQPGAGSDVAWNRNTDAPFTGRDNTLASGLPSLATGGYEQGTYSSARSSGVETCSGESGCCPTPGGNTNFTDGSTRPAGYSSPAVPYTPGSTRPPPLSSSFPTSTGLPSQPASPTSNPFYYR